MSKPSIVLLGKRYWPAHGGVETYMRQTAAAAREFGDVVIVVNAWRDEHRLTHAGMYPLAPAGKPYRDPEGNLVVPLSPSFVARIVMLPLLMLQCRFVANTGNGAFRPPFFSFVQLACGRKLSALCSNAALVHSFEGNFLAGLGCAAAARLGIPFVVMPFVHPGSWGDDAFNRRLYPKADVVLTACEYEKAWFGNMGVAPESLAAAGGYPEVKEAFSVRTKFGIRGPLVLFYGRREAYKGWELLQRAWEDIGDARRDWWLAFVGAGFEESIDREKHIATLPPPGGSPMADCDIFCMPSKSETFGLVYVEAWTHAKPVVACDIPSSRELFHGEQAGLLVKWDSAEISDALARLMRDSALRGTMGACGRSIVERYYSRERYEQNVRGAYRRCMAAKGARVVVDA
jgi:phosphatidyl-myo-inositol dimannoside synthase